MPTAVGSGGMSTAVPVSGLPTLHSLGINLARNWANVTAESMRVANVSTSVENRRWILTVDATILSLTILGASIIIFSMAYLEWRGRPATTRMRIVQSLVVSDLCLGITGLIGVTLSLHPGDLKPGQACDGLGVVLVAVLWSEHLWTMTLAIATFMILIHPLHRVTLYLEKRWWHLAILVWVISIVISVAGWAKYGVVPSGGLCYYPSSDAPLFGPLMQFIPRAVVFILISVLYARLFIFLRRPDKIRSPYSDSPSDSMNNSNPQRSRSSSFRPIGGIISALLRKPLPKDYLQEHVIDRRPSAAPPHEQSEQVDRRPSMAYQSPLASPTSEIPPWERVELPVFHVDGQRYGGATNYNPQGGSHHLWANWKGLSGGQTGRKRPSTTSSSLSTKAGRRNGSDASTGARDSAPVSPSSMSTARLEPIPSMIDPLTPETGGDLASTHLPGDSSSSTPHADFQRAMHMSTFSLRSDVLLPRRALSTDGPTEGRPSGFNVRRASGPVLSKYEPRPFPKTIPDESEEASLDHPPRGETLRHDTASRLASIKADNEHGDGEEDYDLMRMLQESAPPDTSSNRFAPGETVELVEESMASYLNRKTALLMLWFPLGYVLLFSVSLIRIIYDFGGRPSVPLRAVSRWFIFAQGILDALIYGLVEWHTKRVVRRRIKKGTISQPRGSQSGSHVLNRNAQGSFPNPGSGTGSAPGHQSKDMTSSRRGTRMSILSRQGVTFGGTEQRPLLPEHESLDKSIPMVTMDDRRGSGKDSVDTKTTGASVVSSSTALSGVVSESTTRTGGTEVKAPSYQG